MVVFRFDQDFYFAAFKDTANCEDDAAVYKFAKARPRFQYSDLSNYQKFSEKYSSEGWFGRKVLAIPVAAYYILCETISHIALGILALPSIALFVACSEDSLSIAKLFAFRTARQLQIGFGHLATLCNDKYGMYHVQEGNFYITCYKCWAYPSSKFFPDFSADGTGVIITNSARNKLR